MKKYPAMHGVSNGNSNFTGKSLWIMFGKNISEKERKCIALTGAAAYAVLAMLYFLLPDFPYKIALPVSVIAVFSLRILPWQISLALLSSALGDICGASGSFMGQIEFFAVAHLFLIMFFVERWFHDLEAFRRAGGRQPETRIGRIVSMAVFSAAVLAYAVIRIVMEAPAGTVRGCAALYAVIICMMMFCALVQRSRAYSVAAILFVFSDAVIGWNAFVAPVPGEKYLIMIPYYLSQLTFFLRAAHLKYSRE